MIASFQLPVDFSKYKTVAIILASDVNSFNKCPALTYWMGYFPPHVLLNAYPASHRYETALVSHLDETRRQRPDRPAR